MDGVPYAEWLRCIVLLLVLNTACVLERVDRAAVEVLGDELQILCLHGGLGLCRDVLVRAGQGVAN